MKFIDNVMKEVKNRRFKYIFVFWLVISIQLVMGTNLQGKGYLFKNISDVIINVAKVIIFTIIFVFTNYFLLKIKSKIYDWKISKKNVSKNDEQDNGHLLKIKNWVKRHEFLICFLVIIICWIPTLLAFYPSIVSYDGRFQIRDYFFFRRLNMGHPIITTFYFYIFYAFGFGYLNSPTLGMLTFSIFQMSVMALIFACVVRFVFEESGKKYIRNISLIFYAIFPYNQLLSITTTKDVIFAGFVLLFIIYLYKMIKNKNKILDYIAFSGIIIIMLAFRNNAVYALILLIPILLAIMLKDDMKVLKNIIIVIVISIILYQCLNNVLVGLVKNGEEQPSNVWLWTFSQAIGKISKDEGDSLKEEEKEKIKNYYTDYKQLGESYRPAIADRTVNLAKIKLINENKIDFLKFSFQLAQKYPQEYLESALNTIRGYWYLNDNSFCSINHDIDKNMENYGALELFCFKIGFDEYEVKESSKLPKLKKFYKDMLCKNKFKNIYVIRLLFQPALYFYILFACLLYSIYKRQKLQFLLEIYLFLYFLTCFLSPGALVRYIYAVIVCIPVILGLKSNKK